MSKIKSIADLRNVEARRICLIKPSALGDIVQSLPLLPVLKERFPKAEISWVVNDGLADLLTEHPHLDEVIKFERHGTWKSWWQLCRDLKSKQFDLVFDLQGLLRTAVMTYSTAAPIRIGMETAREGSHLTCHHLIPDSGRQVPAHLRYWRIAEAIGMGSASRETIIKWNQTVQTWQQKLWAEFEGKPVLTINPGARWITKRWPVDNFAAVAAKAIRAYGYSIVIVGSPDEKAGGEQFERALNRMVPTAKVKNLVGATSLKQLAAVLANSDIVLSNDSGPMHLAAGLGTPIVGLFTCTSSIQSGPPPGLHQLVSTNVGCAASYKKNCPHRGRHHMACHNELSVERAWTALQQIAEIQKQQHQAAA